MSIRQVGTARFFFFLFLLLGMFVAILSVAIVDNNPIELASGLIVKYALLWSLVFAGMLWGVHLISWRYRHGRPRPTPESG